MAGYLDDFVLQPESERVFPPSCSDLEIVADLIVGS